MGSLGQACVGSLTSVGLVCCGTGTQDWTGRIGADCSEWRQGQSHGHGDLAHEPPMPHSEYQVPIVPLGGTGQVNTGMFTGTMSAGVRRRYMGDGSENRGSQ